jgi:hypothetical protein
MLLTFITHSFIFSTHASSVRFWGLACDQGVTQPSSNTHPGGPGL